MPQARRRRRSRVRRLGARAAWLDRTLFSPQSVAPVLKTAGHRSFSPLFQPMPRLRARASWRVASPRAAEVNGVLLVARGAARALLIKGFANIPGCPINGAA